MPCDYDRIREENNTYYGLGNRHLELLAGRLYSDRTHFIYEILQNAEDARAKHVRLDLHSDRLEVRHDGRRFNEVDVRGICGIGEGTKGGDLTQIGTFGVGFKSVFAFTERPQIHCRDEHFCIEDYVRPYSVSPVEPGQGFTTLFVFPLKVPHEGAADQLANRLKQLGLRTLLFLRRIAEIRFFINGDLGGVYHRTSHRESQIVRKVRLVESGGDSSEEERWLVFEKAVHPSAKHDALAVEIAFLLSPGGKGGQRRVQRITSSPLFVSFSTDKETYCGFLLQGPYRTTLARDNIPHDDPWNARLVKETSTLLADSLPVLKSMGLLTVDLLETLPITPDKFRPGSMFRPLFDRIRTELRSRPFLPTVQGKHVAGVRAKLARGQSLVDAFSSRQLRDLFQTSSDLEWLSTDITERRSELHSYLVGRQRSYLPPDADSEALVQGIEVRVENIIERIRQRPQFLIIQSDKWLAQFYGFLLKQRDVWQDLRTIPFVRLEDGRHVMPFDKTGTLQAYLPSDGKTGFAVVKRSIVQDPDARHFLEQFGLTAPDEVDAVLKQIVPKYKSRQLEIPPPEYQRDLEAILSALKNAPGERRNELAGSLEETPFIWSMNAARHEFSWRCPREAYSPIEDLRCYFEANDKGWFVAIDCLDTVEGLPAAIHELGAGLKPRILREAFPETRGYYARGLRQDCDIDGLKHFLTCRVDLSRAAYLWELLREERADGKIEFSGSLIRSSNAQFPIDRIKVIEKTTRLFDQLTNCPWVPDKAGALHRPNEISLDELHESLLKDDGLAKDLRMKDSSLQRLASDTGLELDDIRFLKEHREEFRKFRQILMGNKPVAAIIEGGGHPGTGVSGGRGVGGWQEPRPLSENVAPTLEELEGMRERIEDVIEEMLLNEPSPGMRFRCVPRKVWESKDGEGRRVLEDMYGGQCQVCGESFLKHDGRPYFEGLYLAARTVGKWTGEVGNLLCLCATCRTKLLYGTLEPEDLREHLKLCLEKIVKENLVVPIRLCGQKCEITYHPRHVIEFQALVNVANSEKGPD